MMGPPPGSKRPVDIRGPMVTGLVANMLWVNPDLTLQEIRNHLEASYHGWTVREEDETQCVDNGCHLIHWDCDSYQVDLLDYESNIHLDHEPHSSSTSTTEYVFNIDIDDGMSNTTSSTSNSPTAGP